MTEPDKLPKCTAKEPQVLTLDVGNYAWCTCGLTKNGAFCDGSHRGTEYRPKVFHVTDEPTQVALCQCKQTKNPPFCDGSHSQC